MKPSERRSTGGLPCQSIDRTHLPTHKTQTRPPQHLRDHFTLFLYVPTEQVGVIIGKKVR